MTFGQLRTFLEVARRGSVRAAATALVVTEPSVSAALASLRDELGVDLVERAGRGIRLTPAGSALERYAAGILGLADQAVRDVRETAGEPGNLRLAAVTTAAEFVLPRILKRFRTRYRDVEVSLEVGNRAAVLERLASHEADLGFGGRPPEGAGFSGTAFQPNPLVIVAAGSHKLAARRAVGTELLSGETWLVREPGSGTRRTTEEFLAEHGIEPRGMMTLGSNGAVAQAAALGLGIALVSTDAVATELRSRALARLRVRGTPIRRWWFVLYPEDARLPPAAAALVGQLRHRTRSPRAPDRRGRA
jgi:DNA-binding transcriptional LysR family regulator